jgi:hypothetical protein
MSLNVTHITISVAMFPEGIADGHGDSAALGIITNGALLSLAVVGARRTGYRCKALSDADTSKQRQQDLLPARPSPLEKICSPHAHRWGCSGAAGLCQDDGSSAAPRRDCCES